MNDFTKEELEDILETYYMIEEHSDIERKVISKIQSLIDNYCEHNPNKPNFTQEQKDFICRQIGEWYLMMKPLLEGQHNLGYMKEKLKQMVCDE